MAPTGCGSSNQLTGWFRCCGICGFELDDRYANNASDCLRRVWCRVSRRGRYLASLIGVPLPSWIRIRFTGYDSPATATMKQRPHRITHAIAARALVLREFRTENIEDSGTSVIQAILESAAHDAELLEALASELRTDPWTKSVEWTETGSEAE
jgi:hypothetical protein